MQFAMVAFEAFRKMASQRSIGRSQKKSGALPIISPHQRLANSTILGEMRREMDRQ
jgi:hypothetical protein